MNILTSVKRKSLDSINSTKKRLRSKKLSSIVENNNLLSCAHPWARIYYNLANLSKIILPREEKDAQEFESIIFKLQTIEEKMQKSVSNCLFKINASKIVCAYMDNDINNPIFAYSIPEDLISLKSVKDGYKNYINFGLTQKNYIVRITDLKFIEKFYGMYKNSSSSNFDYIISLLYFILHLISYKISMKNIVYSDIIFTDDEKYITLNNIHKLVEPLNFDSSDNLKWFLNYIAIFFDLLNEDDEYNISLDKNYYDKIVKCKNFHYFSSKFINLYDRIFNKGELIDASSFSEIIVNELNNLSIDGTCVYNRERFSSSPDSDDNCFYLTENGYNEIFSEGTVIYSTNLYDVIKVVDTFYFIYKNFNQEAEENINLLINKFVGKSWRYNSENVYNIVSTVYHDNYNHPIGFTLKNADSFIGGGHFTTFSNYIKTKGRGNIINVLEELYNEIYQYNNTKDIIFKKEIDFDDIIIDKRAKTNIIFRNIEDMVDESKYSNSTDKMESVIAKTFIGILCKLVKCHAENHKVVYDSGKELIYSMSPFTILYFEQYIINNVLDIKGFCKAISNTFENLTLNGKKIDYYSKYVISPKKLPISFVNDVSLDDKNILKLDISCDFKTILKYISDVKKKTYKISRKWLFNIGVFGMPKEVIYTSTIKHTDEYEAYGFRFGNQKVSNKYYSLANIEALLNDLKIKNRVATILNIIKILIDIYKYSDKISWYFDINSIYFDCKLKPYINLRYILENSAKDRGYADKNILNKSKDKFYIMHKKKYIRAINKLYKSIGFDVRESRVGISLKDDEALNYVEQKISEILNEVRHGKLPYNIEENHIINPTYRLNNGKNHLSTNLFLSTYSTKINDINLKYLNSDKYAMQDYLSFAKSLKGIHLRNSVYKNVVLKNTPLSNGKVVGYLSYISKSRKFVNLNELSNLELLKCLRNFILFLNVLKENHLCLQGFNVEELISFSNSYKVYVNEIVYLKKSDENVLSKNVIVFLKKYFNLAMGFDKERIDIFLNTVLNGDFKRASSMLSGYIKSSKKFCIFHNIYYSLEKYKKCPLCSNKVEGYRKSEIEKMPVFSDDGREAIIYNLGNGYLGKIYRTSDSEGISGSIRNADNRKIVIGTLITNIDSKDTSKYHFIIPKTVGIIVDDNNEFSGTVIEEIENSKPFRLLTDGSKVKEYNITLKDKLKMLVYLSNAIEFCHNNNIYIGDVSHNNVLFNVTTKEVAIIDLDSANTKAGQYSVYTEPFLDPLSVVADSSRQGHGYCVSSFESDYYSFAVMAFYVLTLLHPFNGVYRDKNGNVLKQKERMIAKISVLGEKEVIVPPIIKDWDWMSDELVNAFIDIFEREKRFNIGSFLAKEYKRLFNEDIEVIDSSNNKKVVAEGNIPTINLEEEKTEENTKVNNNEELVLKTLSTKKVSNNCFPSKFSDKGIPKDYVYSSAAILYECNKKFIIEALNYKLNFLTRPFSPSLNINGDVSGNIQWPRACLAIPHSNVLLYCDFSHEKEIYTMIIEKVGKEFKSSVSDIIDIGLKSYPGALNLCINSLNGNNDKAKLIDSYNFAIRKVVQEFNMYCGYCGVNILADLVTQKWLVIEANMHKGFVISMEDKSIKWINNDDVWALIEGIKAVSSINNAIFFNNSIYYATENKICSFDIDTASITNYLCENVNQNSKLEIISKGFRVYNEDEICDFTM